MTTRVHDSECKHFLAGHELCLAKLNRGAHREAAFCDIDECPLKETKHDKPKRR